MNRIMKKAYLIPAVEVVNVENDSIMHYTGPASVPAQMAPPQRRKVF